MNEVLRAVHPLLRDSGFKKQGHAFARNGGLGITHALQFVMRRHELHPDHQPGLYGAFMVELGVYLDAVDELLTRPRPRFVRPYDCHIRERVGALLDEEDVWWTLAQPLDDLGAAMAELVSEFALPWFDRLTSVDEVLEAWDVGDLSSMFAPEVAVALLHYFRGEQEVAAEIIRGEVGRTHHRAAAEHFVALGRRLGLDISMDDANVVNLLAAERRQRV